MVEPGMAEALALEMVALWLMLVFVESHQGKVAYFDKLHQELTLDLQVTFGRVGWYLWVVFGTVG